MFERTHISILEELILIGTHAVSHTFIVKNTSDSQVRITKLRPSCGCTSVFIVDEKEAKPSQSEERNIPILLQPNAVCKIGVAVNIDDLHYGPLNKWVSVYTDGAANATVILDILAEIESPVTIYPKYLNLGRLRPGESHTDYLYVTTGKSTAATIAGSKLVSDDPTIVVSKIAATDAPEQARRSLISDSNNQAGQFYKVLFTGKYEIGRSTSRIRFELGKNLAYMSKSFPNALVTADITGDISCSPSFVDVGTVYSGQSLHQTVILIGVSRDSLTNITARSDNACVSVRILNSEPRLFSAIGKSVKYVRELDVCINSGGRDRVPRANVFIKGKGHQMLIIPVVLAAANVPDLHPDAKKSSIGAKNETLFNSKEVSLPNSFPSKAYRETIPFESTGLLGNHISLVRNTPWSTAIIFVCGCKMCKQFASTLISQSKALHCSPADKAMMIFAGTKVDARWFADENLNDHWLARIVPDPDQLITERMYGVQSCPMVMIASPDGRTKPLNITVGTGRKDSLLQLADATLHSVCR